MPSRRDYPIPEQDSPGTKGKVYEAQMLSTMLAKTKAVKRNDKGELWFLHRVNLSNLHNLDTTFEETSDGKGAIVKIPITAEVNVNLFLETLDVAYVKHGIGLVMGPWRSCRPFLVNKSGELYEIPEIKERAQMRKTSAMPACWCQDKMFQLWRLVLLCGLLTGTSAFLIDNSVVTELQSALRKELEIDDSASKSVLEKVKADFELLQDFTCLEKVVTDKIQEYETLLDKNIIENLQLLIRCLRLTIRRINIGNITLQATLEGTSINLSIPITAKVTLTLPLLGAVVDLTLNFVVQKTISIKIQETGTLKVVIGECTYRPARIPLPFVNSSISSFTGLISNIKKPATSLVNLVEMYLVQDVMCPRIRTIISSLSGNLVQNVNDTLQETTQQIVN
ncbi:hypothetical protein R6Z07F_012481 [Ovis aries]